MSVGIKNFKKSQQVPHKRCHFLLSIVDCIRKNFREIYFSHLHYKAPYEVCIHVLIPLLLPFRLSRSPTSSKYYLKFPEDRMPTRAVFCVWYTIIGLWWKPMAGRTGQLMDPHRQKVVACDISHLLPSYSDSY